MKPTWIMSKATSVPPENHSRHSPPAKEKLTTGYNRIVLWNLIWPLMTRSAAASVSVNSQMHAIKSLIFTFTGLKAIFEKNAYDNTSSKGFLGLLNEVLAFVTIFPLLKKRILGFCCCFTKAL